MAKSDKKNQTKKADDPRVRICLDRKGTEEEIINMIQQGFGDLAAPHGQVFKHAMLFMTLEDPHPSLHNGVRTIMVERPYTSAADGFEP